MASMEPAVAEPAQDEPAVTPDPVPVPGPGDGDRGRHRLPKQRTVSRGSTVLGVAAMAAVGAGGVAAAQGKSPVPVSVPDLVPEGVKQAFTGESAEQSAQPAAADEPVAVADPGEALRNRILAQVDQQKSAAERAELEKRAAAEAKEAAARRVREEAEAKRQAVAEAARKAEAERIAKLARSYVKPVASYTPSSHFGEVSSLWATTHTGQDFAAPTGTPVTAVHSGTITSAGWAGSYGYRIVLRLDDGTELWFCHLSSMVRTSGQVTTGDVIGRVGATGNVTGPHLHLEVRPDGGAPIDPVGWLAERGLTV
ncbi:M23 family metallopeptidase [Streptantibioticus cattleyicolor]|uniref:Putative peptidase n=2 Tax=Streptomycetaceae TaxID=2062 RepID=F8JWG6_STREN